MLRQGQAALGFGAVGAAPGRTGSVETAPDVQGKRSYIVPGREGARVMISRPHRLTTEGTRPPKWLESTGGRWGRTGCCTCHGTSFPLRSLPIVSGTYDRRLAQFAILEKKA